MEIAGKYFILINLQNFKPLLIRIIKQTFGALRQRKGLGCCSSAAALGRYSSTLFTADDRGYARLNRSAIGVFFGIGWVFFGGKSWVNEEAKAT